jgi:hypothetical protein
MMQIVDYKDFTQNISEVFDKASFDDILINTGNGQSYRLSSVTQSRGKSPFEDVPCLNLNITPKQIVEILNDNE